MTFFCFFFVLEIAVADGLAVALDTAKEVAASRARFAILRHRRFLVDGAMSTGVEVRRGGDNAIGCCAGAYRQLLYLCVLCVLFECT